MNKDQALKTLGLNAGASESAMRKAFAILGNERSRDRAGYDQLVEAARVLGVIGTDRGTSTSGAVLAVQDGSNLAELRRESLELERLGQEQSKLRHEQSQTEIRQIVEVRVDPLRRARRRYVWATGVSGLLAALALLLRGVGGLSGIANSTGLLTAVAIVAGVGATTGVIAAAVALQVQSLDGAFQDVAATLSRRSNLVATMKEILGDLGDGATGGPILERDLERAVGNWMFSRPNAFLPWPFGRRRPAPRGLYLLARKMRPHAFTQVLVSKGKECDLFDEQEELNERGDLVVSYRVKVAPRAS